MKTPSQPRAIYYIVAIQIWEYFSFYGMRALLILYLTHQLGFDDNHAISLFSAYASLVYVTPILGGWLADRLLGNRTAVIAGALLMTLGHVVLGIDTNSTFSLYLALAIIICGYGLFKSNISCLLGSFTTRTIIDVMAVFRCCMLPAISVLSPRPIACGLAAQWYGWHVGFALAGGGMFIGLLIFLSGHRHFQSTRSMDKKALTSVKICLTGMELVGGDALFSPSIFYPAAGERLVRIFAGDRLPHCRTNHCPHDDQIPRTPPCSLANCIVDVCRDVVLGTGTTGRQYHQLVYRSLCESYRLFNIEVPTALFQSVNAIAVMLAGVVLAVAGVARKPRQLDIARLAEICLRLTADGLWLYVAGV